MATDDDLARVHDRQLVEALDRFGAAGGGDIDADTAMGPGSMEAARLAAGAGLELVDRLEGRRGRRRVLRRAPARATTPRRRRAMGFCLFNNVAVVAAALADRGREGGRRRLRRPPRQRHRGGVLARPAGAVRVAPRVAAVPRHRRADRHRRRRRAWAPRSTSRCPAGATGDVYRRAVDDLVAAGRRGPRDDLAAGLGRVRRPPGRPAHRAGPARGRLRRPHRRPAGAGPGRAAAAVPRGRLRPRRPRPTRPARPWPGSLDVDHRPEAPTAGGPGGDVVAAAAQVHRRSGRP